jgi:transcriptional regulator with XRE-family HTH domain
MNTLDFLKANEHKGDNTFMKEAQYTRDNWGWLKYSYAVAIKVKQRMDELNWTQKQLAESLGCTQQHISVLLKGRANMTLETIAKLEEALNMDLIGKALSPSKTYPLSQPTALYLNESGADRDMNSDPTSTIVDGYTPRKKKGPKRD